MGTASCATQCRITEIRVDTLGINFKLLEFLTKMVIELILDFSFEMLIIFREFFYHLAHIFK